MQELKLYYMDACPYCRKVLRYMDANVIDGVKLLDVNTDPKNQEELMKFGGIDQVPMLLIDEKPLYESDDIIQWFEDNK